MCIRVFFKSLETGIKLRLDREKLASSELSDVQTLSRYWQLGRAQNIGAIAECYVHFGELDKALQNYKIAIAGIETFSAEKDNDLPWSYVNIAKVYKKKNDSTNCKKYCAKARQMIGLRDLSEKRRDQVNREIEKLEKS
jgi:tetratricopeptide (TPR) repeat protein